MGDTVVWPCVSNVSRLYFTGTMIGFVLAVTAVAHSAPAGGVFGALPIMTNGAGQPIESSVGDPRAFTLPSGEKVTGVVKSVSRHASLGDFMSGITLFVRPLSPLPSLPLPALPRVCIGVPPQPTPANPPPSPTRCFTDPTLQ